MGTIGVSRKTQASPSEAVTWRAEDMGAVDTPHIDNDPKNQN
jgi:hypothetical protein